MLEERLAIAFKALMCRHYALEGTKSDVSSIHWQYGAIARLKKGEKIDKLLHGGYKWYNKNVQKIQNKNVQLIYCCGSVK